MALIDEEQFVEPEDGFLKKKDRLVYKESDNYIIHINEQQKKISDISSTNNNITGTKIIHYTHFDSMPDNNKKVFINFHQTRYDILTKVTTQHPF